jgi:hypothetical protein
MQSKLFGIIIVDFDATDQLVIIYSAFIKYLRRNGTTVTRCISYLYTSRKVYNSVRMEVWCNILWVPSNAGTFLTT